MLANVGSHWIDQLIWWFGPVRDVFAQLSSHFPTRRWADGSPGRVDTEDAFALMLLFRNGATGILRYFAAGHHTPGGRMEAYGSDGTIILDSEEGLRAGSAGEPLRKIQLVPFRIDPVEESLHAQLGYYAPFLAVVDGMARRLRGETLAELASFADGLRVQRVLDAARLSHRENRPVSIASWD